MGFFGTGVFGVHVLSQRASVLLILQKWEDSFKNVMSSHHHGLPVTTD